jgi:hypothetical protein
MASGAFNLGLNFTKHGSNLGFYLRRHVRSELPAYLPKFSKDHARSDNHEDKKQELWKILDQNLKDILRHSRSSF